MIIRHRGAGKRYSLALGLFLSSAGAFKYGLEVVVQLRSLLFTDMSDFFHDRIMPLGHPGLPTILQVYYLPHPAAEGNVLTP